MDNAYDDDAKGEIQWNDPELAVTWPMAPTVLSPRDTHAASFKKFLEKTGGGLTV
jgi:dTDP-4-dehydrorhamnose 3,5-epimerase-like enzyme